MNTCYPFQTAKEVISMRICHKKPININFVKLIGLYIVFFSLLFAFRHRMVFIDENDNFLGGIIVASGGDIYKNFISQHMPLMYYITAIFRILGATSIFQFRLYFYALLSFIWVAMYRRYYKCFGSITMILYPISYIMLMASVDSVSFTVLSEQLQAQGLAILLLEFLLFCKTKEIKLNNAIAISISILISFGTAFVSVFAIFTISMGVFIIELKDHLADIKKPGKIFIDLLKKYWKLICLVILPFALLFFWYLFTDNIRNAFHGIYSINKYIYPKYNGGFGTSILKSLILTVDNYFSTINSTLSGLVSNPLFSLRVLLNVFINILFVSFIFSKNKIASLTLIIFILMCGSRTYLSFHSLPYWGISALMGSILLNKFINRFKTERYKITLGKSIFASVLLVIIVTPYFSQFSTIVITSQDFTSSINTGTYEYFIDKLTTTDDKIQVFSLETNIYLQSNRMPAITDVCGGVCPWIYEMYGNKLLDDLKGSKPKVIVFNEQYEVWGYKYADFAPEIISYVKANYTQFKQSSLPALYVRNDYYQEAIKKLSNH